MGNLMTVWPNVLSAGLFLDREHLDMFQNEAFDQLAESVLGPEGYIPRLLSTSSLERFSRAKAVAKLKAELVTHASAPNPVGSFYFWNRTRRCVALSPFRLLRDTPNLITPFLEHKLFDLLSSLPAEHFLDHSFHTEAISRAYPELSDLAYEDKSQKPIPSREELRSFNSGPMRLSFNPRRQAIAARSLRYAGWPRMFPPCTVGSKSTGTYWACNWKDFELIKLETEASNCLSLSVAGALD